LVSFTRNTFKSRNGRNKSGTHSSYKLIDSISNEIYLLNVSNESWNEEAAKKTSKKILEIVEEFQQKRSNPIF
jgi:hypothetical protein